MGRRRQMVGGGKKDEEEVDGSKEEFISLAYKELGHRDGADDPSGQKEPAGHSTDDVGVGQ